MLEILLSPKTIQSLKIILVLLLIYIVFNSILKRMFNIKTGIKQLDSRKNKTILSLIRSIMKYFLIIVGVVMLLRVQGIDTTSIVASLGVASAVIALAFQDTIKDLLAGIFIILENQYNIGDTIKVNDFKGEVISVGLRTTKLKAITGEYCFITNKNIGNVINYSMGNSVAVVNVEVAYKTDLKKVEKVIDELSKIIIDKIPHLKSELIIEGVEELDESGVVLRITANTTPAKNLDVQRLIKKEIKEAFEKNNIEIPFKQVVIHNG